MNAFMTVSQPHPDLIFSIHPLAHTAYEWVLSFPTLIEWHNLPTQLTNQLLRQPLQGIMRYRQQGKRDVMRPVEFQLFAPLWPALYWDTHHPPAETLLIHNTSSHFPDDEDIEQQAWASVMGLLALSINSGELASLREHFQTQLPHHVAQHFFGKDAITDADLTKWTGFSRGTLVQQRQRAAIKTQNTASISDPIALLNTDWSLGHEK